MSLAQYLLLVGAWDDDDVQRAVDALACVRPYVHFAAPNHAIQSLDPVQRLGEPAVSIN